MKMKKVIFFLPILFAVGSLIFLGCSKSLEKPQHSTVSQIDKSNIGNLAADNSFIRLNNAINRFDPTFLKIVYQDTRSISEIIKGSEDLLVQYQTDPENKEIQNKLAEYYHFSSIEDLLQTSATIQESYSSVNQRFHLDAANSDQQSLIYKARILYVKNKIDIHPDNPIKKKVTGIWMELVESQLSDFSDFNYLIAVYDETLETAGEGGGDVCLPQLDVCKAEARSAFIDNFVKYAGSGAATFAVAGIKASLSSAINTYGMSTAFLGIAGGIFGGGLGTIITFQKYYADLDVCKAKFKLCLASNPK